MINRDIGAMTLWEWLCAIDGYGIAHGVKPRGYGDIDEDRLSDMGIEGF